MKEDHRNKEVSDRVRKRRRVKDETPILYHIDKGKDKEVTEYLTNKNK